MKYFLDHRVVQHKKLPSPWYIFVPHPLMQKSFYSIKENKCSFFPFFFNIQRLKVKKVSSGNHRHIVVRACSLLMLLLRSGGVITNLLLMLRPCFTWLLSSQPPHHQTELMTESDGCWHQVAPMGGETDSYHDNLRIGNHLTCRAAGDSRGASVSRCILPLKQFFVFFISLRLWINLYSICDELQEVIIIIFVFICFRHHAKG